MYFVCYFNTHHIKAHSGLTNSNPNFILKEREKNKRKKTRETGHLYSKLFYPVHKSLPGMETMSPVVQQVSSYTLDRLNWF